MKIIIIGGSHAGMFAAEELIRTAPQSEVIVYDRSQVPTFAKESIPNYLAGEIDSLEEMHFDADLAAKSTNIKVCRNHSVLSVDSAGHQLEVVDMATSKVFTEHYDRLIVASGAANRLPLIPGVEDDNILLVRSFYQVQNLRKKIAAKQRIVIVGGGQAGLEFTVIARELGKEVHLLERSQCIGEGSFSSNTSQWLEEQLKQKGVLLHDVCHLKGVEHQADGSLLVKTNQENFETDLIIIAMGFVPNTSFIENELETDLEGAILVNEYLQTSSQDIYAIGDCATVKFKDGRGSLNTRLSTRATRQGFVAAHNILGSHYKFIPLQGTTGLRIFDHWLAQCGYTLLAAKSRGFDVGEVTYKGPWIQEYQGISSYVDVHVVYDRSTRQLLGVRVISAENVLQYISVVAVMLQNKNTIDDLAQADILYEQGNGMPVNFMNFAAQRAVTYERLHGRDNARITLR
ncbi:NADH oxidase [Ligilactobacillus salitolerans]|uniref:NADH oxidase n=1 Tax=Ligilactobacillus salitolerans TaxID=1808352 RepID=A0A401IUU6_9LACO|nr:FAD-dependent oxidoreductase [Ligilactobacillus salitolerans]GBG95320.1 NADH oxidase [Ligilactobacillus salitolerans]